MGRHDGHMRLLVLGGTWFVGHAVVTAALDAGWEVTAFNRGTSAPFPEAISSIKGDRHNPEDLVRLAAADAWDAVVDTSGYVPSNTLAVARALASHLLARGRLVARVQGGTTATNGRSPCRRRVVRVSR